MEVEIKKILEMIEEITFSKHFYEKAKLRGINEEEIKNNLKNLKS